MIHLTHEQIAKRAYEIYLRSGSLPGRDEENWLAAEIELKREIETAKVVAAPKPNGHSSVPAPAKATPVVVAAKPVPPVVVPPIIAPAVTVTHTASVPGCGCTPTPAPKAKAKAPKASKSKARF